jgi:hypothetical protein
LLIYLQQAIVALDEAVQESESLLVKLIKEQRMLNRSKVCFIFFIISPIISSEAKVALY